MGHCARYTAGVARRSLQFLRTHTEVTLPLNAVKMSKRLQSYSLRHHPACDFIAGAAQQGNQLIGKTWLPKIKMPQVVQHKAIRNRHDQKKPPLNAVLRCE